MTNEAVGRTQQGHTYLTIEEKQRLRENARRAGLTQAEYLRHLIQIDAQRDLADLAERAVS